MKIQALKTGVFEQGDDITSFIEKYAGTALEKTVIVVTSKIVALSEHRVAEFRDEESKEILIKAESDYAVKTKWTWMTIKDKMLMANAGIDESNAKGKLVLLPRDSFKQAEIIRDYFCSRYGIKDLGVVISDSHCIPLRAGVIGAALGYAGFHGLREYAGKPDIFGRELQLTHSNVPDSLAAAAVLCMGEGNEQQPLALITGIELEWSNQVNSQELDIDPSDDMFHPLFENLPDFTSKA